MSPKEMIFVTMRLTGELSVCLPNPCCSCCFTAVNAFLPHNSVFPQKEFNDPNILQGRYIYLCEDVMDYYSDGLRWKAVCRRFSAGKHYKTKPNRNFSTCSASAPLSGIPSTLRNSSELFPCRHAPRSVSYCLTA